MIGVKDKRGEGYQGLERGDTDGSNDSHHYWRDGIHPLFFCQTSDLAVAQQSDAVLTLEKPTSPSCDVR